MNQKVKRYENKALAYLDVTTSPDEKHKLRAQLIAKGLEPNFTSDLQERCRIYDNRKLVNAYIKIAEIHMVSHNSDNGKTAIKYYQLKGQLRAIEITIDHRKLRRIMLQIAQAAKVAERHKDTKPFGLKQLAKKEVDQTTSEDSWETELEEQLEESADPSAVAE